MFLPDHLRTRHAQSMRQYFTVPIARAMGSMDLKLQCRDGQMLPVDISLGHWDDEGVSHAIAYIRDLTERQKFEESLRHQAAHDELTGLPNRTLLLDRLAQVMTLSERNTCYAALLLIDLDNFKTLNDTLGHDVGDQLIKQVANRLTLCVHDGDTVARLGGDEFVVILSSLNSNEMDAGSDTKTTAKKILDSLSQTYRFGDQVHNSTASIGATLFRGHAVNIENLMKQADIAMYRAKETGRNTIRFFDPTMETAVLKRVTMEKDLRDAIVAQQFILHYQAQVADKGRITGAEVLLRWQHPQRGMVPPMDFIPLAEETGLILPLGQWVLETACIQLAMWAKQPELAELTLAVNVSSRQFRQADFVTQVLGILEESGANPLRLKLELTESLLVDDVEEVIAKMLTLKAAGVGFSLDDFGTGYSSLSYLKRLPLDQLKIDQSFVRDVLIDQNDAAIARTVVALAEGLGL
ncbi:MAG: EAL domain-containing protein, partial [Undibacterium sp.]|nr:EAL domain-containing protein [Undibacterium sp.]